MLRRYEEAPRRTGAGSGTSEGVSMTDKSAFTETEWHALTDAPLLVTTAV
ncbi:MAG: hypothetical protein JWM72_3805, partial [Actinomycetia bacterium]|nr:hypothetical protein [Actinomycetes bacterium]